MPHSSNPFHRVPFPGFSAIPADEFLFPGGCPTHPVPIVIQNPVLAPPFFPEAVLYAFFSKF